jgi:pilus assembly protein Flp/PilA
MEVMGLWQQTVQPWIRARFGKHERGAALVEYALLLALIAVVCIIALEFLGEEASEKFSKVGNSINSAGS